MVNILQVTKKGKKKIDRMMTYTEAKKFLYNLSFENFQNNDFFLFKSTHDFEIEKLRRFFKRDYLIPAKFEKNNVFLVNSEINKNDRLVHEGINLRSIENFRVKIEKLINNSRVEINEISEDNFMITVKQPPIIFTAFCSYQLEIESFWGVDEKSRFANVDQLNEIYRKINALFVKQRYYYRKKSKRENHGA
jgi:hypothetical protein